MRYITGFLIGLGLIVLAVILVIRVFGGGGDKKDEPKPVDLASYSTTDTVVRLSMDGPTGSEQEHQQLRITVGKERVVYERLKGYQGEVIETKDYANNPDAYSQFLKALAVAGFTNGNDKVTKDESGFCPAGRRYVYEAIGDGESLFRWWSTSCGGTASFKGRGDTVRSLFKKQVIEYNTLTRKTPFDD